LVFIWFGLFHVVPWILINAHHQRSVDRYVLIQENDPHPVDESGYNLYKVARILSWVGLPEEVENLYSRAIAREPNDPANRYNLALYYYRQGELDQALWVLDVLLTMHPAYPKANCLIGKIYLLKKDPAKALTYLERASPYLADNPDGLYHLGSAYYLTGQFQKAEACALQIIEMAPARLKGYRLLGKACGRLGDFDRARQAWEHILSIRPGDAIALRNLKELKELKEFRPK
jgi:tetratricopeptide (TPR) repeat protein